MSEVVAISKQLRGIGTKGRELQRQVERAGELYRDGMKRLEADYVERLKRAVDALTPPSETEDSPPLAAEGA
jgi:hypothetical protein